MLNRILQIFMIASISIGLLLAFLTVLDFTENVCADCWPFENLIAYSYILTGILVLSALAGAGIGIMKKPESLKMMLVGIVGTILLFGISYGMASSEITPNLAALGGDLSEGTVKMADTGLIAMYIMMFLSIAAVVFSSIMKIVRR
ncbi:MAG: hypothetical protein HOH13_07675 [Crocinitomicaceae bacterium]|nr:hypothetical protein [Crocinitomicaceae bacterium]